MNRFDWPLFGKIMLAVALAFVSGFACAMSVYDIPL